LLLFALTTFTSAFLLFQVQPLLSKRLLPWFGGSPAVWTTCVLFFQTVLFAGYAYAHLSEHWLPRRVQAIVHLLLLGGSIALLPIFPADHWKPDGSEPPVGSILSILGASVGVAYLALSSTGPLVAAWFSRVLPGRSPYRLYALSNVGSLLALLTYPFIFEPAFDLIQQANYWAWGFGFFAFLSAASTVLTLLSGEPDVRTKNGYEHASEESRIRTLLGTSSHELNSAAESALASSPRRGDRILWIVLPAFASLAFLATTNVICQDVAVVPFLWIAPLSLYLVSFIICFDHERWYHRRRYAWVLLGLVSFGPFVFPLAAAIDLPYQFVYELVLYLAGMFCVCMICHGESVILRPAPRHLTSYYLSIAGGGAIGGMFVSLVAPVLFSTHYEWAIAAIGACFLSGAVLAGDEARSFIVRRRRLLLPIAAVAILVMFSVGRELVLGDQELLWQARNFYGVVTVSETRHSDPNQVHRLLMNGRITHGIQFTAETKRRLPTSYYGPESGVGQAIAFYQARADMRVGAVGLGIGTVAAYARAGHIYRFYEINPHVIEIAKDHFTFLEDCEAEIQLVLGDARLSLESESPMGFHVLVLDAFSGDAIPTHLLTTEAFATYERHLRSDGALCIHVSNQYLDLTGVAARLAKRHGFDWRLVDQPETKADRDQRGVFSSDWMVLSKNAELLAAIKTHIVDPPPDPTDAPLWTDAHTDLFRILK
jgi:hypothetical protein